jgi:adenylate cyclase
MKRLIWVHIAGAAAATLIVAVTLVIAHRTGHTAWMDRFFYDTQVRATADGTVSGDVMLVLMDAQSAARLERGRGGWSRTHLADALDVLCKHGASVIGVDLVLSAPDPDPHVDQRLARSMERCGNVVLARASLSGGQPMLPRQPFLDAAAGDGFIDLPLDSDDVLRRVPFFHAVPVADSGVELIPAFSLELARVYRRLPFAPDFSNPEMITLGDMPPRQLRLPYPDLLIRYPGDYRAFDGVSFAAVVNDDIDPARVKGKLVVIGSHLAVEKDYFTTPFTRFNRVSTDVADKFGRVLTGVLSDKDIGVACQAFAAETILSGRPIRRASAHWVTVVIVGAAAAGSVFYLPMLGTMSGLVILGLFCAALAGGGYLSMSTAGLWFDTAPGLSAVILQFVGGTALQKTLQHQRARWLSELFGKYVSKEVVADLMKKDVDETLAGASLDVSLLFADLRDFTSLSERLGPENTRALLNRFFEAMIPVVFAHNGTLDKLMGDALMVIFGAPIPQADHPDRAAQCALEMVGAMDALAPDSREGGHRLQMAIGINSGTATVGNMGTDEFMDYTAIGDTVNLASRLEGINRNYGTRIIIGPDTARRLRRHFVTRRLDRVRVAGRDAPVDIHELVCTTDRKNGAGNGI